MTSSSGKRILIVDGSRLVRDQITNLLQGFGYRTVSASSSAEGMGCLTDPEDIGLVVLDVVAPGKAMIGMMRSQDATRDLPVLVLASTEHIELVAQCLEAGCDDYLVKPVDPRLLYQRIQSLLESHPRSHRRVQCNVVAEVSTGPEQLVGEIHELCERGAGLLLNSPLDERDIVKVSFFLPREADPVVLGAEVVYCRGRKGRFQHGLNFIIVDEKTRERMRCYIETVEGRAVEN